MYATYEFLSRDEVLRVHHAAAVQADHGDDDVIARRAVIAAIAGACAVMTNPSPVATRS